MKPTIRVKGIFLLDFWLLQTEEEATGIQAKAFGGLRRGNQSLKHQELAEDKVLLR